MSDVGHLITVADAFEHKAWLEVDLRRKDDDSRVTKIEHWHGKNTTYWLFTTSSPDGVIVRGHHQLWYKGDLASLAPVSNPRVDEYYAGLELKLRNNWRRALRLPEIRSLDE
jgi:hypothetical protein